MNFKYLYFVDSNLKYVIFDVFMKKRWMLKRKLLVIIILNCDVINIFL